MALFTCKLGSADGKVFERDFEAANPDMLRQSLEEQGYYVFEVKKKLFQFLFDTGISQRKISNKDLLMFNQELLVLIKAGIPIVQVLDAILERIEKGRLGEVLRDVREEIKGGASLSEALAKHPRVFPHLYVASIRAGEKTGDLPLTIRRYNAYLKKTDTLKKKFIGSLFYPAILVTVAFAAISVLLLYVVPTFSQVYADAGSQLPLPTQILISFTGALKRFLPFIIAAVIFGIVSFRRWSATEGGRFRVDATKLKLPVVGDIVLKYALTSFSRTLATIIGSGIPIVESLRMSVGTLNNKILERRLLDAITKVEEGLRLSVALESVKMMPPLAIRMLGVGETTGALEEMLTDISEYLEEEIEGRLAMLSTAVEPAIMIVMGVVVGAIIIAMYLPIFKIAGTVG